MHGHMKMKYMPDVLGSVIERIMQLKGWFCGFNKRSFYASTQCMYNIQGVPGGMCQTSGECSLS